MNMFKKIYEELIAIRKELQVIRNDLERKQSFNFSNSDCDDLIIEDIQKGKGVIV